MLVSEWNIDFLIAVLLLNESLAESRGKANSNVLQASFGVPAKHTQGVNA